MAPDTPGSVAPRTPRRTKGSAAPASRAFVTGLSLAATCTIIAALAMNAPAPEPTPAAIDLSGAVPAVAGAAGSTEVPVDPGTTIAPVDVAIPVTSAGASGQIRSAPVQPVSQPAAGSPNPTPTPAPAPTATVAPAPTPTAPRVTTPPTTVARTRAS